MRAIYVALLWLAALVPALAGPLDGCNQVVLVLGRDWNDVHATLQRFERTSDGWKAVGEPVPAVLGDHGLGWGRGLGVAEAHGPVKREGDRRAPAGLFRFLGTFGFAPREQAPGRMPYLQVTDPVECVDDVVSPHYNQVVDRRRVAKDWASAERMRRVREYRWGAFVGHNQPPSKRGAGSCIFFHIWDGPDEGTAGCTAVEEANVLVVLNWLRPEDRPVLVQLPQAVYGRVRTDWGLP